MALPTLSQCQAHLLPKPSLSPLPFFRLPNPSSNPSAIFSSLVLPSSSARRRRSIRCSTPHGGDYEHERVVYPRPQEVPWSKDLANSVHLIGIVGAPVQIKHLSSGKVLAWTRLAVRKSATDTTWLAPFFLFLADWGWGLLLSLLVDELFDVLLLFCSLFIWNSYLIWFSEKYYQFGGFITL